MSIGKNIRNLRKSLMMTQCDLAAKAHVSQGQLSEYERDIVAPTLDSLGKIADALSVSVAVINPSLLTVPGFSEVGPVTEKASDFPVISTAAAAGVNTAYWPLADWAEMNAEQRVSFSEGREGDVALRVEGDSMLPWYPAGTILLVRPGVRPRNGQRVIAVLGGGEIVFKVFVEKERHFFLCSINGSDGKNYRFRKDDCSAVRAVYVVIQSMRSEDQLDRAMADKGVRHFWQDDKSLDDNE